MQADIGQRHLGDFMETHGEGDGTEDEQTVVDGHSNQNDGFDLCRSGAHQQSTHQVHHHEDQSDSGEDQVQSRPGKVEQVLGGFEPVLDGLEQNLWLRRLIHKKSPVLMQ